MHSGAIHGDFRRTSVMSERYLVFVESATRTESCFDFGYNKLERRGQGYRIDSHLSFVIFLLEKCLELDEERHYLLTFRGLACGLDDEFKQGILVQTTTNRSL